MNDVFCFFIIRDYDCLGQNIYGCDEKMNDSMMYPF